MALTTRVGAGALLTQSQGDANWDTLNGINEGITATTHTVDHTDENKTIEYSNASGVTVTLTALSTLTAATDSQISDFSITLKNIGVGDVTVNCSGSDTFEDGSTSLTIERYKSLTLQTDSTGGKWNVIGYSLGVDSVYSGFPSGTAMLFYQAAAPTGWTGDATAYDHTIKIVASGSGGSATGTVNFSTLFARTATDAHTLTTDEMPAHVHGMSGANTGTSGGDAGGVSHGDNTAAGDSDSAGGDQGHTHDIDMRVKYLNVIVATKD